MTRVVRWKWPGLLFSLFSVFFWLVTSATAFDLELSVNSGYDDNPRQEKGSEGALFTQTELDFDWALPQEFIPATSISLFGFAAYQCYSGLDNNWQLGSGLGTTTQVRKIPGNLSFFTEIASYRNPLISDNDYESLSLGSSFIWFAGPQLSLEIETSLAWEDYRDTITRGQHPKKNSRNVSRKAGQSAHHNSGDRNDRLFTTSLKSLYAFSPDFDGTSSVFWRRRHSSIDAECRTAYGLNLDLNWRPIPAIEFNWQLGGERSPYKYKYQKRNRTENIYKLGAEISWYLKEFTLQASFNWDKRNSSVNEGDYQRNQWQIRLKYSY